MGKRKENFFVVFEPQVDALEDFDTMEEAKEYIADQDWNEDEMDGVLVYEVVKAYTPKTSGVELEEVDV